MRDKEIVETIIIRSWRALTRGYMNTKTYEATIDGLCDKYGTEFVSTCYVDLTREGKIIRD